MNYTIQIDVRDESDRLIKIIRGNELRECTTDLIDTDVKNILNDMTFKTRNIRYALEKYEQYLDDLDSSTAYGDQIREDRAELLRAVEEIEALL
jgi:hypothetical protein